MKTRLVHEERRYRIDEPDGSGLIPEVIDTIFIKYSGGEPFDITCKNYVGDRIPYYGMTREKLEKISNLLESSLQNSQ